AGDHTDNLLSVGETLTFIATGDWADGGPHRSEERRVGKEGCGDNVTLDEDSANYVGVTPDLDITKDLYCPDDDKTLPDGAKLIDSGDGVHYKIVVTNNGTTALDLSAITVNDPDVTLDDGTQGGVAGDHTDNLLSVGETLTFIATGDWADGGPH